MANDVSFDLKLAVKDYNTSLQKANSNMDKFSGSFEKSTKNMNSVWGSFVGNLAANAVAFAGRGLLNLASSIGAVGAQAIENAGIQEDAINDLNIALKATGTFTEEASKDFQNFASELQKTSTVGDEAILKTAALGAQMSGLAGEDLKKATEAAVNMSAALGVDLNTAMTLIAKSATDSGSGLKRYGIVVDKGATSSETLANAIEAVSNQFSGAALGKVETYSGAITQAENSYGDMLEEVGNIITQSPVVISLINQMSKFWSFLGGVINDNRKTIQDFVAKGLVFAIDGFISMVNFINPVINTFRVLGNVTNLVWQALKTGMGAVLLAMGLMVKGIIGGVQLVVDNLPDVLVPEGWKESLDGAQEAVTLFNEGTLEQIVEGGEAQAEAWDNIGNAMTTNLVGEEKLQVLRDGLNSAKDLVIKSTLETNTELDKIEKKKVIKQKKDRNTKKKNTKVFLDSLFFDVKSFEDSKKDYEVATDKERKANLKSTLGSISTLTQSNNSTLATIGKAAAISTATIDGITAVQKALASAPPPFNFALAALVGTATAANVAKIAGVNFQHGGIVAGSSFTGDNNQVNVNSGEMILNRSQQAQLFQQANNGGGSSSGMINAIEQLGNRIAAMEIVIVADDNEIGRSVSRAVEAGVVLGRS